MFEDLIPSALAAPAPPPGLFDDLIPASDVPSGYGAAITDIPREIATTTGEAWEGVRRALPSSLGGERNMAAEGPLESLTNTGKGLVAAATLPLAPVQGVWRSLIGHPMVEADQALRAGAVALYGEDKVRAAEQARGLSPGGMTYDEARRNADTALSLIAPRGGLGLARPAVRPPPPASPAAPTPDSAASVRVPEPELPPLHEGAQIIDHGPLGPVLDGYQNRWADAVDWLRRAQTGDARGVLEHPDVPDGRIDVIWGAHNPQTDKGFGLAHIAAKHAEVLPDLPERLARMRKVAVDEAAGRIYLESPDGNEFAAISQNWHFAPKNWLLTAFDRRARGSGSGGVVPAGPAAAPTAAGSGGPGDQSGLKPAADLRSPLSLYYGGEGAGPTPTIARAPAPPQPGTPAPRDLPQQTEDQSRRGRGSMGSPPDLLGPTRSSGTPGSGNVGVPSADNKFEVAPAPAPLSQQQIAGNRAKVVDSLHRVGVPPDRVDPADIECAARLVTRRDVLTLDAFKRAVIGDALERGFATPQEVDQVYGKGTADEYRGS